MSSSLSNVKRSALYKIPNELNSIVKTYLKPKELQSYFLGSLKKSENGQNFESMVSQKDYENSIVMRQKEILFHHPDTYTQKELIDIFENPRPHGALKNQYRHKNNRLKFAQIHHLTKLAQALQENGAIVLTSPTHHLNQSLLNAIRVRNEGLASAAIIDGANIDVFHFEGGTNINDFKLLTSLQWKVNKGQSYHVETLLRLGADLEVKNFYGETALHLAASYPFENFQQVQSRYNAYFNIVQALVGAGANVNAKTTYGKTPLHLCLEFTFFQNNLIAEFLVNSGADLHATDNVGHTPLHIIALYSNFSAFYDLKLISLLLRHGADLESKDIYGNTPLDLALRIGNENFMAAIHSLHFS